MAVLKKHSTSIFLLALAILLVSGFGLLSWIPSGASERSASHEARAQAQASDPTTIDPLTHARLSELRERLGLLPEDLAAMGCSKADAANVLQGLLAWLDQNRQRLETARQHERQVKRQVRELLSQMNVGPADPAVVTQYHSKVLEHQRAIQDHQDLIDSAVFALQGQLDFEQQTVWRAIRDNRDMPRPYRYLSGLSDRAKDELLTSLRKHGMNTLKHQEVEQRELGYQQALLDVMRGRQRQGMPGVLAAQEDVYQVVRD